VGAAFFDLDKTLWPCVGEKAFAIHHFARGDLALGKLVKVLITQLRFDQHKIGGADALKRQVLAEIFSGLTVAHCLESYDELFSKRLRQAFFPEMVERIERHRAAGDRIVIVSAAIDIVASPVAAHLRADDYFATNLEVLGDTYSGVVTGLIPFGEAKARIVEDYAREHGLDLSRCHAYGDHWEDRHMLEVVGFPNAVNPQRKLLKHARMKNWKTQSFNA
jgi:HAD superfamily hydrolase (TIGR01490 family)